jgi:hypothetical protein
MKKKGLAKVFLEEAKSGDHARPTPTPVLHLQDLNLEHIAGLGAFDSYGTGERMNPAPIDGLKIFHARAWRYLAAAGVEAAHVHRVSR